MKSYIHVQTSKEYIEAENRRLRKQAECPHEHVERFEKFDKFSVKCLNCKLILESDASTGSEKKLIEIIL